MIVTRDRLCTFHTPDVRHDRSRLRVVPITCSAAPVFGLRTLTDWAIGQTLMPEELTRSLLLELTHADRDVGGGPRKLSANSRSERVLRTMQSPRSVLLPVVHDPQCRTAESPDPPCLKRRPQQPAWGLRLRMHGPGSGLFVLRRRFGVTHSALGLLPPFRCETLHTSGCKTMSPIGIQ